MLICNPVIDITSLLLTKVTRLYIILVDINESVEQNNL